MLGFILDDPIFNELAICSFGIFVSDAHARGDSDFYYVAYHRRGGHHW